MDLYYLTRWEVFSRLVVLLLRSFYCCEEGQVFANLGLTLVVAAYHLLHYSNFVEIIIRVFKASL